MIFPRDAAHETYSTAGICVQSSRLPFNFSPLMFCCIESSPKKKSSSPPQNRSDYLNFRNCQNVCNVFSEFSFSGGDYLAVALAHPLFTAPAPRNMPASWQFWLSLLVPPMIVYWEGWEYENQMIACLTAEDKTTRWLKSFVFSVGLNYTIQVYSSLAWTFQALL